MGSAWIYFYIHFLTEIVCFFTMSRLTGASADSLMLWFLPLFYDALAFVPQSILGHLSDRFPRLHLGIIGAVMLAASSALFACNVFPQPFIPLIILCLGNCCLHVNGAEVTLRSCSGKLSHSAVFVAGGSFGVISGKLFAMITDQFWYMAFLSLTIIPFVLLAEPVDREGEERAHTDEQGPCAGFHYASASISPAAVILIAVFVVVARGYMGYGIPTSWNKTTLQTVFLFCSMGLGKALGGILSDWIGVRKVAIGSLAVAFPLLLAGDQHMMISLTGVMFFSMTMSTTLAILVSVLPSAPGLAFGLTTIGLFFGTVPIFFFRFSDFAVNCGVISLITALCIAGLAVVIPRRC